MEVAVAKDEGGGNLSQEQCDARDVGGSCCTTPPCGTCDRNVTCCTHLGDTYLNNPDNCPNPCLAAHGKTCCTTADRGTLHRAVLLQRCRSM